MKQNIQEILDSLSTYIVEHQYEETPFLTAYVGIDTTNQDNRRERPAWLIELKNEARRLEEEYGTEALKRRDTQNKWANIEEMVMGHLQWQKLSGRSAVIFTDGEDFLAIELPVPIPTQLFYGPPQLKPLLFELDRYKKCLVALLSEEEKKLVEVFLTATTNEVRIPSEFSQGVELRQGDRRARTQASERRDLDSERRRAAEAAEEINDYFLADSEIEHIILGGNTKLAHAVRKNLHPTVYDSVITIEPIAYSSTNNEIAAAIRHIADEKEREHDLALVEELISRRHAGGTAVLETQGVLRALEQGQVSKLVLSVPIDSDKFDKLLLKCLLSNCDLEFVHGEAADKLNGFGGIAAVLYYSGR